MPISLLQPLSQTPIVCIDTETTGASPAFGHRVIEIGVVRLENGRIVERYQQLIDPARPISAGVTALTGISQPMVAGQPRFTDQLPTLLRLLDGAAVLGHNVPFDLSFLGAEFRRCGACLADCLGHSPILDTVRIARRRFGRGGNSLPILSRRLGVDPDRSHRALADALTTAAVFEKLLEPVGGFSCSICDAIVHQGGAISVDRAGAQSILPLELEEALENGRPVMMEYVDASGARTHRAILPRHVRRHNGELLLVAHCHLRNDQRTFKLDRIVRLSRMDEPGELPSDGTETAV